MEQWNRENPDSPLFAGRAILAVNGHEKSHNIMNELRSARLLEILGLHQGECSVQASVGQLQFGSCEGILHE